MKSKIVLFTVAVICVMAALVSVTESSPIAVVVAAAAPSTGVGRQAAGTAAAAATGVVSASPADDDDDDDEDDIEDALDDDEDDDEDDDDDDDDDEEGAPGTADDDDDDDDEDYLERFFDDILGEDDDDDDDDDVSPSTGAVQPPPAAAVSQATQTVGQSPVSSSAQQATAGLASEVDDSLLSADYASDIGAGSLGNSDSVALYDDETGLDGEDSVQVFDEPASAVDAAKEPTDSNAIGDNIVEQSQAAANVVGNTVAGQTQAVGAASGAVDDDDDDDDDDEDDIADALDDDDDDDDDDDEDDDDDDDDDDDLIGEDVIEAKRSRALSDEISAPASVSMTVLPEVLVPKYNRFVDSIFERINTILKRSYDPVSVRLSMPSADKTKKDTKQKANNSVKRKSVKGKTQNGDTTKRQRRFSRNAPIHIDDKINANQTVVVDEPTIFVGIPDKFQTAPLHGGNQSNVTAKNLAKHQQTRATQTIKTTTHKNQHHQHQHTKTTVPKTNVANNNNNNNNKNTPVIVTNNSNINNNANKMASRARGTLYGLSTLKRVGDVRVTAVAEHTTVRSNFILGPLTLKVEKSFGRGARRELRSATATTAEMMGRISLRVVNGVASLHSIKVQQPKQVKVQVDNNQDNQDRTREFVWKRSAHIAHVVSEKLTSAARLMLVEPISIVEN